MKQPLDCSSYRFSDRDEYCLRTGTQSSDQILLIPPLFDEMNRMRHMIVDTMRILSERGVGTILPDLPGSNESLFPQRQTNLEVWRDALKTCLESHPECSYVASFRGGCLIDGISNNLPTWRLTPVKGKSLLRAMMRTRIASDKEAGSIVTMSELTKKVKNEAIELAGNILSPAMFEQLHEADIIEPNALRTMRLDTDSQPADGKLAGSPLWLRAEPEADPILSQSIADDLEEWIKS
ncbi:MAG: hypothetical protein ABJN65_00540 [Parasphingorhabdus sp.]